jgi:hypothetical protein
MEASGNQGETGAAAKGQRVATKKWLKIGLVVGGGVLLLFLIVGVVIPVALVVFVPPPKAYTWILPDGYAGWVRVDFGVVGAKPLPVEDGYRVLRVPESGVVETCDPLITSPSREQHFYEKEGSRRPAPTNIAGWTSQKAASATRAGDDLSLFAFFGTAAEWKQVRPPERTDPSPGRIPRNGSSGP